MDAKTKCWELQWAVERSIRYHARRQGFFDRWRLTTAAASVILGSGVAVNIVAQGGTALTLTAALLVTVLSAVDLVVGTAVAARLHSDLRRRFLAMEADILCTPEPSEENIQRWTRERLSIEADEPPIYVGLDLLCENEMARAHGQPPRAKLSGWQIAAAHWLRQENIADQAPA